MTALVLALLVTCAVASQAPAGARAAAPEQTGSIRGRITAADTGKPLRRARVNVRPDRSEGFTRPVTATTNSRGEFEVAALAPGWYLVDATRAGFVSVSFGQRRADERGQSVQVRAGTPSERIDIALPRGGVLAGRVVDDLGQPYPGVRVDALALRYSEGKRQPAVVGVSTTDDLGNFRMSGLAPGSYYVAATSTETWRNEKKETIGYPSTYYPAGGADQAKAITLAASEQRTDLQIALQAGRTVRISGRVVREGGEPVPGAGVSIAYSYPGVIMSAGARIVRAAADGSFQINDVPGGVYSVSSGGDDMIVTVSGVDVEDVLLTQRTGSTVTGTIVTDDGGVPPFPVSGVRVFIESSSDKVLPTVRVVQVNDDWTFKMQGLGGPFLFRLSGLPDDWTMAAATLGERNISDEPFDVPTGGKEITGAKIVVTRRIGRVTGSVADDKGRPTGAAAVIVFSDEAARWIPYSRFVKTTRPGADGRFSIGHLPPGIYRAVALDFIEQGQEQDAAFLAELRDAAKTFSLGEGGAETLTLTVRVR
jgi:protocatechuate 3,4-dioxygenase beta subunit